MPFNHLIHLLGMEHDATQLVTGVAIDSRNVQPGHLFFALPGKKQDGHTFLAEVASKGASGAVISTEYRGETFGLPVIQVPDVLLCLQDLARKFLQTQHYKVVAITGSLGKTTTKEFALGLVSTHYKTAASPFSYNSQATLPLCILNADPLAEILLLEMGMTEPGNIDNLVSIAPPDIAVLTTVAAQHTCNFSDGLTGVSREKAAIFSHPKTLLGILHRDMHHYEEAFARGRCQKIAFSTQSLDVDYFLEFSDEGAIVICGEEKHFIPLSLPLKVHYHNFLCAVVIARVLDVPWEKIIDKAPSLKLPPMRFEKIERQGITFINDAYNANPDSMKAALENLPKPISGGKTIAVLSEMDALGMYSEVGHALVAEAALQAVDTLLCVGARCEIMRKIWKKEKKVFEMFETKEALTSRLKEIVCQGDVVLLKGARAYSLEHILQQFES